jgi:hypothetical protein
MRKHHEQASITARCTASMRNAHEMRVSSTKPSMHVAHHSTMACRHVPDQPHTLVGCRAAAAPAVGRGLSSAFVGETTYSHVVSIYTVCDFVFVLCLCVCASCLGQCVAKCIPCVCLHTFIC